MLDDTKKQILLDIIKKTISKTPISEWRVERQSGYLFGVLSPDNNFRLSIFNLKSDIFHMDIVNGSRTETFAIEDEEICDKLKEGFYILKERHVKEKNETRKQILDEFILKYN